MEYTQAKACGYPLQYEKALTCAGCHAEFISASQNIKFFAGTCDPEISSGSQIKGN